MSGAGGVLLRASAAGETVRAMAAVTTEVVEEARQRHGTYPTATAALGRTLTAGLLLGATMKDEEGLSIELVGDGPLRRVMVTTTGGGQVRGYVSRPATHLPSKNGKLDVAGAIGDQAVFVPVELFGIDRRLAVRGCFGEIRCVTGLTGGFGRGGFGRG